MKEILEKLDKLSTNRPLELIKEKAAGKKVIEYFGDFVPEQWMTAAGVEDFLIMRGGDPQPPEATLDYMLRFMNPLAASMVGNYLLGLDAVMPIADKIVIQQHDSHYGRMCEVLEYKGLPVYKVGVPADYTVDISRAYYRNELRDFRKMLEELVGHPIDDEAIRAAYAKTNEINDWLRKIDELRKKDNPPITFSDFIRLNHYTLRVDYDTSIEALKQIYAELENAPGAHAEGRSRASSSWAAPSPRATTLSRASSRTPAAPSSPSSWTRPSGPSTSDIPTEGDVVEAYAKAIYDDKVPQCIFQPAWETRFEHLKKLIEEYRVDAVLWYQLAFDEIYDMEHTCVAKWIKEINVPIMKLETSYEYSREAMAPLTTRLESFVESIKEAK